METRKFTQDMRVLNAIDQAQQKCRGKHFSDVIDDQGHQYVDLVLEGGGVLGIALAGYTYFLEQMGIRFLGIAGTSAGAINALLLACAGERAEHKTPRIVNALANVNIELFMDGDSDAVDFIQTALSRQKIFVLAFKAAQIIDNLQDDLGLNPGTHFHQWLKKTIAGFGVETVADLRKIMAVVPSGLRRRVGELQAHELNPDLALVAADITTESRVHFPAMAPLYWADPESVNPADFVRASMAVPFFFTPFAVENIPQTLEAKRRWSSLLHLETNPPDTCLFVDGGIMSNFPIDIFHKPLAVPGAPTFGARLGHMKRRTQEVKTPLQALPAIFNAARHTLDFDFFIKNPDYRQLVKCIDTGDHHWLNFSLTEQDRIDLFIRGVEAAKEFVIGFDWQEYKRLRAGLRKAFLGSAAIAAAGS